MADKNKFCSSTEELIEGLNSQDVQDRVDSAWALSELGREAVAAVPALTEALRNPEDRVVLCACDALRAMDPDSRTAIPVLEELANVGRPAVRSEAKQVLLFFHDPARYRRQFVPARIALFVILLAAVGGIVMLLRFVGC